MKKLIALAITSIFLSHTPVFSGENTADLILSNGQVMTSDGWVDAIAIRDGVIVALGTNKSMEKMREKDTDYIDLKGQAVLPGFHDMHVHPLYGGMGEIQCKILQGSNLLETQSKVKSCAKGLPEGKWVTGGQWDASAIGQAPHRTMLDAVTPNNPILLNDTSGHSAWVNSSALKIAGITKDTPNPEGGIIERDEEGNPTGVLRESAIEIVRGHIPVPSDADIKKSLKWAINNMLSYGITAYNEASLGFVAGLKKEAEIYASLADEGFIKQHTRLCLTWFPGGEEIEEVIASRNLYARDRLAPDCIKIFLDGVPTDSHTAAMLDDYKGTIEGRTDEASRKGLLLVDQDVLNKAVIRFDKMGMTVKFHAAGDAAVNAGLNAIEAARVANGFSGLLHNVGHCTFVSEDDIPRAKTLGATFEMSPYLWTPSPINDDITSAIGEPRISRVWPIRDAIESGSLVVPGSDWAVVPSVNPWIAVESLVTREEAGGSKNSFGKDQAISLSQAIDMFTVNSAKHMGTSDKVGRIEIGMMADIIVVDKNPFKIPVTELHKTKVKMTFIQGEKLYEEK